MVMELLRFIDKFLENKVHTKIDNSKEDYIEIKPHSKDKIQKDTDFTVDVEKPIKKNKTLTYKERIKKGVDFELHVGKILRSEHNYKIYYHGIDKKRRDKGIDLIAHKGNQMLLIQCKNWKKDGRKIKHNHLKEFIGNCEIYLSQNRHLKSKNIVKLFCTSNYILDKSAEKFIEENEEIIKYRVIPFG